MKHMKHLVSLAAMVMSLMIAMVASVSAEATGEVDFERGVITVKAIGVANPRITIPSQARAMAKRAAITVAQRDLLETAQGVNLTSETTVRQAMIEDDVIKTTVNGVIKGARVINEEYYPDGGCEVTMVLDLYGTSGSLAGAVMPKNYARESFPAPAPSVAPSMPAYDASASVSVRIDVTASAGVTAAPNNNAIGGYTGVIVDCRGLGLEAAMSPVIKNDSGEKIYGHKNLDSDYVVSKGMAAYTRDLTSGIDRAGNNPLVVKAVSVDNRFNPVVSVADANRILIENNATHFLEQTNVVFIR
ncbi:MAG: LPP20 family lipoprotein [Selenomonadaceae bacterium]|nr:LPP20 family lipoprotein [Selenomonadaceae bacterium]